MLKLQNKTLELCFFIAVVLKDSIMLLQVLMIQAMIPTFFRATNANTAASVLLLSLSFSSPLTDFTWYVPLMDRAQSPCEHCTDNYG